jgi:hypothetical protein
MITGVAVFLNVTVCSFINRPPLSSVQGSIAFYTLKVEAVYSSETLMSICKTTECQNPKDSNLHSQRCENF